MKVPHNPTKAVAGPITVALLAHIELNDPHALYSQSLHYSERTLISSKTIDMRHDVYAFVLPIL